MIHERLESICRGVFNDATLTLRDEMAMTDIAGWDSVAHINLMFTLEQEFGVQFSDEGLAEFESIEELKRFLSARSAKGA